jgi:hypothetical protein
MPILLRHVENGTVEDLKNSSLGIKSEQTRSFETHSAGHQNLAASSLHQ